MTEQWTEANKQHITSTATSHREPAVMVDIQYVAALLSCSQRHVRRLSSDTGKMPLPVKIGALLRWNRNELEVWIAQGCPDCRSGGQL